MAYLTKTYAVVTTANVTQTLPEQVVEVVSAVLVATGQATVSATALTPTTGAPGAGQIQFTGKPSAPSNQVTLNAAPAAGELLLVTAVPVGAAQAAA
jgi:hypothetical protein